MGLIHIDLFSTLDLVAQAPGGPEEDTENGFAFRGWQGPHWDDETDQQIHAGMEHLDALLLGRKTYDIFAGFWPHVDIPELAEIASLLNTVPKYVASRTPQTLEWANSIQLGPNLVDEVRALRDRHENVLVIGSLDFVQTLLENRLFDRINLLVYPILLGTGKKVFAGGTVPSNLRLIEPAITTSNGVISLKYALAEGTPQTANMAQLETE
jgi:dihydrofolate reductase